MTIYSGTSGNDVFAITGSGHTYVGSSGNDQITLIPQVQPLLDYSAFTTALNVVVNGSPGTATVDKGARGRDVFTVTGNLTPGESWFEFTGSSANDTFLVNDSSSVTYVVDAAGGNDRLEAVTGYLVADYRSAGTGVVYDGAAGPRVSGAVRASDSSQVDTLINLSTVIGSGFNDTFNGGAGEEIVYGYNGNDVLNGGGGDDRLYGQTGNDRIDGGTGADRMSGGTGNDVFYVDNAGDEVLENYGEGQDLVVATRSFSLKSSGRNVENLVLRGRSDMTGEGNSSDNVITGHHGNDKLIGHSGDDTLRGGNGNDRLFGNNGQDRLEGGRGDDNLFGGNGRDILDGGSGADNMEGGTGNDVYHVDNAGDQITENAGQGTDLVVSTRSFDLSSQSINLENLILRGTANMTGTGNDRWNELTGHHGNDTLNGLAGNDTLRGGNGNDIHNGGRGADLMEGGRGNDIYHVDNAGDRVNESSGQGTDLVISTRSFDLSAHSLHLENLILRGTADMTGTGNDRWNVLTGHHGNDTLNGLAGNDTLRGGNGNDTLNGGRGNDFMDGGRNSDRLDGGSGSDTYVGGSGNDTFVFRNSGGTNTVRDYQDGDDMFEVGLSVGSFSNVTVADSGANTILTFGGTTVVLENVDHNLIGSDDFNFV